MMADFKDPFPDQATVLARPDGCPKGQPELPVDISCPRVCAKCSSVENITLRCGGCNINDIGHLRVYYCNRSCQQAHWKEHKATCKARRQLARAVPMVKELYEAIAAAIHGRMYEIVDVKDGIITTTSRHEQFWHRVWTGGMVFQDFSEEWFPDGTHPAIKKALLLGQSEYDVFFAIKELIELLLKREFCPVLPAYLPYLSEEVCI